MSVSAIPARLFADSAKVDAQFLAKLSAAVKEQDVDALTALTAPGVKTDYSWVEAPPGMMVRSVPWQVKALSLPGVNESVQTTYVAFTKYHPCESVGDHLYGVAGTPSGPRLKEEIPEADTGGFRVRDHKINARFDIPNQSVYLTDRFTLECPDRPESPPILRINAIYTVDSVKREGATVPFRQAGGFLAIQRFHESASSIVHRPSSVSYDLTYHAQIKDGREDYILPDQAGLTAYWYPHTGRLPATSEVRITVPRGWSAVGQGEFGGKTVGPNRVTYAWQNRIPVCYLTVAVGKYTVTSRKIGGLTVSSYLIHHSPSRADTAIKTAAGAIQWFSKSFAPFPYTRYSVVETDSFPAALECYSFTLVARPLIPVAIVHEVAHTWWGGIVPNTYLRSLWNEAFAEYSDGLYGRRTGSFGIHQFSMQNVGMLGSLMARCSLAEAHDAMDMAQSLIGYGKGSLVLENLERMLGLPKMLACARRFVERHKPGEPAEWQDFIDTVVEVAGSEWAGYFPPWLNRRNLPALQLRDVRAEKRAGKYMVTGTIAQAEPAFWLRLPVVLETAGGESRRQVDLREASTRFQFEVSSRPIRVMLDPDHEALRAGGSGDSAVVKVKL